MTMPFYVSPEQLMKDRADFARKGIARGRSVAVIQSVVLGEKRLALRVGAKAGLLQSTTQQLTPLSRRSKHGASRR